LAGWIYGIFNTIQVILHHQGAMYDTNLNIDKVHNIFVN